MMKIYVSAVFGLTLAFGVALAGQHRFAFGGEPNVDYSRDIRPILSDKCYKCHGPDRAALQADLRLDLKQDAFEEHDSGLPIEPGRSVDSIVYQRISSTDPDEKMPPPDSGKVLTPQEIARIKRWIDEGAEWREHWSFLRAERPPLPDVRHTETVQNPIDLLIRARLEQEGLAPSPRASKETLIRRVTLDLTGLPPTLAEIDAFLADDSMAGYERLIDRLLKSTRYGEHRARFWLDAARYGDTHGLHLDNERSIWPYREWVIKAFNSNKPFDEFTIEQLAGDLLDNPSLDQLVATGFNRCNVTTSEGGSIAEEYLVRYAVDRVETTSTVWMGLTAGCAVCHEHKFDPISQKEFYRLFAYFFSLTEKAMDGNALLPPPTIKVPTSEQLRDQRRLHDQIDLIEQQIATAVARGDYQEPAETRQAIARDRADFVWIQDELPAGAKPQGDWEFVSAESGPVYHGARASARTATGRSQHLFTGAKPALRIGDGDTLFAYVYLDPKNPPQEIMLQFNDGSWEHRAFWGEDLIEWGKASEPSRFAAGQLPPVGQWVRLEVSAEKVGLKPGALLSGWAFTQFGGTVYWDHAGVTTRTPQGAETYDSLLVWEQLQRSSNDDSVPKYVREVIRLESDRRNDVQRKQLENYFVEHVQAKTRHVFDPLHRTLAAAQQDLAALDKAIPATLIMQDMPKPRDAYILTRGEYDKKGDKVEAGVPAVLPPLPADAPRNRLALARWLVHRDHPLTARVSVNRFWQQIFGTGIVKTSEDFGSQGEWPSHPELLDWLAVEFMESGWDVQRMIKLMVMSHAYCQSSQGTPELWERDPENRLLARGPRFRMDAEMVRDNALKISGLLVEQVGGKSVRPYQPSGIWSAVGYESSDTVKFVQDHGNKLYRRSMYTFWKRTAPPPTMQIFDAPSREYCVVRRERTNTPKAALALLNDVQFVEAARQLAQRIMTEGGDTDAARATFAFRLATARSPKAEERVVLLDTYRSLLLEYEQDPDAAMALINYGETPRDESLDTNQLAAWTMVASAILNLDETITKG